MHILRACVFMPVSTHFHFIDCVWVCVILFFRRLLLHRNEWDWSERELHVYLLCIVSLQCVMAGQKQILKLNDGHLLSTRAWRYSQQLPWLSMNIMFLACFNLICQFKLFFFSPYQYWMYWHKSASAVDPFQSYVDIDLIRSIYFLYFCFLWDILSGCCNCFSFHTFINWSFIARTCLHDKSRMVPYIFL